LGHLVGGGSAPEIHLVQTLVLVLLVAYVRAQGCLVGPDRGDEVAPGPEMLPDKAAFAFSVDAGEMDSAFVVTFRKKIYTTLAELQGDLDAWLRHYNNERTHQGKMCCGRTPMATFEDGKRISRDKTIA
jgi:hypothetical protein